MCVQFSERRLTAPLDEYNPIADAAAEEALAAEEGDESDEGGGGHGSGGSPPGSALESRERRERHQFTLGGEEADAWADVGAPSVRPPPAPDCSRSLVFLFCL
jgi:hypothetical protein